MEPIIRRAWYITTAFALLALAPQSWATSSNIVINVDGYPTCSELSDEPGLIDAFVPRLPPPGQPSAVTGPDGQQINYMIGPNGDSIAAWEVVDNGAVKPVNFVVLNTWADGGRVFHYGPGGEPSDTDLQSRPGRFHEIHFCYGLEAEPEPEELPPPVVENLGRCDALSKGIDGTIVELCPDSVQGSSDERVILSFSLDEDKENFNMQLCTCNLDDEGTNNPANDSTFEQCDPNATQTDDDSDNPPSGGLGGPCTNGDGFLERVPVAFTAGEDENSFFCFSAGGGRSCYFHFSK